MRRNKKSARAAATAVAAVLAATHAAADSHYWVGGNGRWDLDANWSSWIGQPGGYGQPANGDNAWLAASSGSWTATRDSAAPGYTPPGLATLYLDTAPGASITLNQTGSNMYAGYEYVGNSGNGRYLHTGGGNTVASQLCIAYNADSVGTYVLSGSGAVQASQILIAYDNGAAGTFTQNGGSTSAAYLSLAASAASTARATYSLASGTLAVGDAYVGYQGLGTFLQSGGTVSLSGSRLVVGYAGSAAGYYGLSGGTLSITSGEEELASSGSATFQHTGGRNSVGGTLTIANGSGSAGTYTMSGSAALSAAWENIGGGGRGVFTQDMGANTVTGALEIPGWSGNGTYNLNGGTLTAGNIWLDPRGTFNQTGGTLWPTRFQQSGGTVTSLNNSGTFTYMSGDFTGTLNNTGAIVLNGNFSPKGLVSSSITPIDLPIGRTLTIGTSGLYLYTGTLNLSGGTLNVAGGSLMRVGNSPTGGSGFIDHSGGILSLGADTPLEIATAAGGAGEYSLSAGTVSASQIKVGGAGNADWLQSGGRCTVSGTLSIGGTAGQARYRLSAGTLTAAKIVIGSSGTLSQTGGVLNGPSVPKTDGGGTQIVNDGVFEVSGGLAEISDLSGSGSSTIAGDGSLTLPRIMQQAFDVAGRVTVRPDGTTAGTSVVGQLTIAGTSGHWTGTLDLTDNDLVIDYTGATPYNNVVNWVRAGYNAGVWNGNGIASSRAGTSPNPGEGGKTGVGYAEASTIYSVFPATFSGQSVDNSSVLIKYTYLGDANLDGQVDISDLGILATNWQTPGDWPQADFDYSGFIDISDLGRLATNWQVGVGSPLGPSFDAALVSFGLPGASVPEPIGMLAVPVSFWLLRRLRG